MAARAGIETAYKVIQDALSVTGYETFEIGWEQSGAQSIIGLDEIVAAWRKLSPEIRFSIIALVRTHNRV